MSARVHTRVRAGMRRRHNWVQLRQVLRGRRLGLRGEPGGVHPRGRGRRACTISWRRRSAFVVAVTNNFWWNRHWTFAARDGHAGFQAARFFTVSVGAFVFAAALLELLVSGAACAEIAAQAISIVAATPLNFVGNKMWSFGRATGR